MSAQPLELPRGALRPLSRALAGAAGRLRAAADLRRRAEMAVIERLDPGMSLDILPVVVVVAALSRFLPSRRA